MIIQNNQSALYAANTIKFAGSKVNKSLEKLSSGYRINRGADDASGLGISEEMRAKITGLSVGINNIDQGVAVVQTADKALEEVSSMLFTRAGFVVAGGKRYIVFWRPRSFK